MIGRQKHRQFDSIINLLLYARFFERNRLRTVSKFCFRTLEASIYTRGVQSANIAATYRSPAISYQMKAGNLRAYLIAPTQLAAGLMLPSPANLERPEIRPTYHHRNNSPNQTPNRHSDHFYAHAPMTDIPMTPIRKAAHALTLRPLSCFWPCSLRKSS